MEGPKPTVILSAEDKVEICDLVQKGLPRARAFYKYGIGANQMLTIIEADPLFASNLRQSELLFELYHIARIAEGKFNWQSSAWLLERRFPNRWGRKDNARGLPKSDTPGAGLFTTDSKMVSVALPPGAVPALPRPQEVQNSQSGSPVGQDGELQKKVSNVPVGALPPQPPAPPRRVDRPPMVRRSPYTRTS